jgi:hypothetical protein
MNANNSGDPGEQGGREGSAAHLPNSECEEIVHMLAKNVSFRRLKAAIGTLCPICAQNLRMLLTPPPARGKKDQPLFSETGSTGKPLF